MTVLFLVTFFLKTLLQKHLFQVTKLNKGLYLFYMIRVFLFSFLLALTFTRQCYNSNGVAVQWWVIMKVPPKIGSTAYGYFDSAQQNNNFTIQNGPVDINETALTKTLESVNLYNLSRIAWNDQKPNGTTSSTSAHSKGMIAFDVDTQRGFLLSHSIPKYPNILNGTVFNQIGLSQQVYGQHISCFSLHLSELQALASKLLVTRPYIYQGQVDNTITTLNLYRLASKNWTTSTSLFHTWDLQTQYGYSLNAIFKNAKLNGSIFEDGLATYLNSSQLIAQTWGRPIQPSYCACSFKVKNVMKIGLSELKWNLSDDHSKWVYTDNYACFGDMNRMKSQWSRGGAFYCLKNARLVEALKQIVLLTEQCTTPDPCP